jgi:hypothetical protein
MTIRFNTQSRNNAVAAITAPLTVLDVYTGAQPATGGTAATGTLLGTITGIAWAQGANGVRVLQGTPEDTAVASGTPGWGRFRSADGSAVMDGAVGAEFTITDEGGTPGADIVAGGTIRLASASLTQPAGG